MLNDRASALALLETRRSVKPRELVAPGPDAAMIERILAIASRVPDHGKLAPWRFVVIEHRERFADLMEQAQRGRAVDDTVTSEEEARMARRFATEAPVLIALLFAPSAARPIPRDEQQYSTGAAGFALLAAAHALGYAGCWITGWPARDPLVTRTLAECAAAPGASIAGFFFIGTPATAPQERPRPALSDIATRF